MRTKGNVEKIFARSIDQPRLSEKVAFDREYMPPIKFSQEHECRFIGAGAPFFDFDTIKASYRDVPALELGF